MIVQEDLMKRTTLLTVVLTIMFAASCTFNSTPPSTIADVDVTSFQRSIMTTFDILNGSAVQADRALTPFNVVASSAAQSRATVPVWNLTPASLDLSNVAGGSANGTKSDYPEIGQTSSWTVEGTTVTDVYLVKMTTTFPVGDLRDNQAEWYFIKDVEPKGLWTNDESIVDASGTISISNANFRIRNELTFDDGSIQSEKILDTTSLFAAFDVNGGLDYPGAFIPVADPAAKYSSVVVYTRTFTNAPNYSFWSGNQVKTIVGVRYYTETFNTDHTVLTGSMIVFEKAITSLYSLDGDFLNVNSSLFLPTLAGTSDQAMLALTVIRQASTYAVTNYVNASSYTLDYNASSNTRDTRAKTRVVNIPAQQDNYITLINDEAASISTAYETMWIPTGDDPAIINLATATTVDVKSTKEVVSTDGSAPVSIVTNTPSGDLGTLYVSIEAGAVSSSIPLTNDIANDLSGTGDIKQFTGNQGYQLPLPASSYATTKGTVQAWVYPNVPVSDTPGLVHAGVKSDFSDELWTLQFMGANTVPVFGLAAQSPYKYDLVTGTKKLNTGKWSYVVATWDLAANSMKMYINGRAQGSASFRNVTTASSFATDSPVIIGSQFFDSTKVLPGYYGFNGKINGVLIDSRVWSATEISNFYATNKGNTANW